jgi:hypothetical protein
MIEVAVWYEGRPEYEKYELEDEKLYLMFRTWVTDGTRTAPAGAEIMEGNMPVTINFQKVLFMSWARKEAGKKPIWGGQGRYKS